MSDQEDEEDDATSANERDAKAAPTNRGSGREETLYAPEGDERRRAWAFELLHPRAAELAPAEFVHLCSLTEKWLATGEAPGKAEVDREKKTKTVTQLRSV